MKVVGYILGRKIYKVFHTNTEVLACGSLKLQVVSGLGNVLGNIAA